MPVKFNKSGKSRSSNKMSLSKKSSSKKSSSKKSSSKKLSFGRKRSSTRYSSRNLPYDVKIMMCVREPFVKNSKPMWRTLPVMPDLEIELIKHWYRRFEMEKLIKVLIVHGLQVCVKANYDGKLPSWFGGKISVSDSSKKVDEYFRSAQHIAASMRLGRANMAGLLLKQSKDPFKPISSNDFVPYSVVKARSAFFPGMFPTVWNMLDMKESSVDSNPNTEPGEDFGANNYCVEVFDTLRDVIGDILKGNYREILNKYYGTGRSVSPQEHSDNEVARESEAVAATQRVADKATVGDIVLTADSVDAEDEDAVEDEAAVDHDTNNVMTSIPGMDLSNSPLITGRRYPTTRPPAPGWKPFSNAKSLGFGKKRRSSRFGSWSATTTPMVGFVKPLNISMAESYTGMTDKAYKRHVNSATGTPDGRSKPLYKANDFYGSSALGASLNPMARFGLRRHEKDDDEKPMKKSAKKSAKKPTKKSAKKPTKKSAKKSAFGNFFF
jgi:hypothetical protein